MQMLRKFKVYPLGMFENMALKKGEQENKLVCDIL